MKRFIAMAILLLFFGCIAPEPLDNGNNTTILENQSETELIVESGDTVLVDYAGFLENGSMFDTSVEAMALDFGFEANHPSQPLQFIVGDSMLIPGFENAVIGMKIGEETTVVLEPSEAYGEVSEELIIEFELSQVPEGIEVGSELVTQDGIPGTVMELTNETATVDFNHNLAGKTLTFQIFVQSKILICHPRHHL